MNQYHQVEDVKIVEGIIRLTIERNRVQRNLRELSEILATAKENDLREFEVSPSGYGIYRPLIDEDISIDGLLGIEHHPEFNKKAPDNAPLRDCRN
ncbi:MAG TPA: DUF2442 domain-containing protein [Gammaproteobacteria bacterium]|nr:DUF2442 domain-containing protein [Gammaproteobacteria bacterium]